MFTRRSKPNQPQDYDMTIKLLVNVITILNGMSDDKDSVLSDQNRQDLATMVISLKKMISGSEIRFES